MGRMNTMDSSSSWIGALGVFFLFTWWWIIRLPGYLLKSLKVQIGCFTSQICRLKSWMELRIREPFVSHSTRPLTLVSRRKLGITSRDDLFVFFRRIIFLLFVSQREKKTYFFSLWFSRREKSKYLSRFPKESFHSEGEIIRKTFFFIFNSNSFWVVLKLLETALPFFHLFGSGWVSPLGHPNQLQQKRF